MAATGSKKDAILWALRSYGSMIKGFSRTKREARKLDATLPELPVDVPTPDSDEIYAWIEEICETPHRRAGTAEGHRGEEYVESKFREFGLEHITKDPIEMTVWKADNWGLVVRDLDEEIEIPSYRVVNTGFTGPEGVTAPMVYVGALWLPDLLKKADVRGKIVVADVPFPTLPVGYLLKLLRGGYRMSDPEGSFSLKTRMKLIFVRPNFPGQFIDLDFGDVHVPLEEMRLPWDVYWNAYKQGAAGVVLILSNMVSNSNSHSGPYDRYMKPIPALWVGKHDGLRLRSLAKEGATATLVLEGEKRPGVTHNVWGILPGISEDLIVLQSHHDAPFKGATEDGCGVGQVLAQARAWSRVPEGRRNKSMLFLCAAGHFHGPSIGAYEFVKGHRDDLLKRADAVICLEHLGARQVEEVGRGFRPTGELATTYILTSPQEYIVASAMRMLKRHPLKRTVALPSNLLMPVPPTDAFPHPFSGVGFLSWITQPYYLLSAEDTLEKIEIDELGPIAEAVTDLVKTLMVIEGDKLKASAT